MESGNTKRINQYLRDMGVCSRRKADELITRGLVEIESGGSRRTATLGDKAGKSDRVYVNGKLLSSEPEKEYILYYKPKGVICTTNAKEGRTVAEEFDGHANLTYAGRLDKESEGLLLMTNDGILIDRMMRGRYRHEKEYECTVDRDITSSFLDEMSKGVDIGGVMTRPCTVRKISSRRFDIILTQGLNRQIRKMCAASGYEVVRLKRIRIMNLTADGLAPGEYRKIGKEEIRILKEGCGLSERGTSGT